MSSSDGSADNVSGLEEFVPEPLMPVWDRFQAFQAFRETHGDSYTKVLEAVVAVILTGGYLYWLFLFFTA
ncbi:MULTISPECIES: hypothetical protein [Haloferax]|uniref:Yip1 domain-containing protein n=1 Tax=Haloferax marinum TaxID=2666143 RepID=A0A6A8GBZ1_9EURY|nr:MULTISPECIES: hypothetical protein [Haloferax]KAB1190663.1 hypothetical protein Hfx1150_16625 [Haloferax sp. CBA1150]MRW98192.1 hypothetical protein [Haloferax marinum]